MSNLDLKQWLNRYDNFIITMWNYLQMLKIHNDDNYIDGHDEKNIHHMWAVFTPDIEQLTILPDLFTRAVESANYTFMQSVRIDKSIESAKSMLLLLDKEVRNTRRLIKK